jgi:hypothetical protein
MAQKIGHHGVTSGRTRQPFFKTNEFQTGMELQSQVGGQAKKSIHSQSVGLEGTDQCGFQSNFPVSGVVKKKGMDKVVSEANFGFSHWHQNQPK